MTLPTTSHERASHGRPTTLLAVPLVVLLGAVALLLPTGARAATTPAVGSSSANPPAFIPNWDGHTDSTMLSYSVLTRSSVTVQLIDARGKVVDVLERSIRDAGTHVAVWDGRTTTGTLLPAGTYRLRVDAKPVARVTTPGEPGSANAGVAVIAGSRDVAVVLQAPPVAITGVELTRGAIGRAKSLARTQARFVLSAPASVSAVVVDAQGRVVRTLHAGHMEAGARAVDWQGATTRGRAVADGDYTLLVAAAGPGRPTETMRQPLRVDRTVPTLRTGRVIRAKSTTAAVTVPVKVVLGEAAKVRIRIGRRVGSFDKAAGTHVLSMSGASMGLKPRRKARSVRAVVTATDATGNLRTTRLRVVIPGARATRKPAKPTPPPAVAPPAPTPPVKQPVESGPPAVTGAFTWPIDGILTSPFGPRDGRMHQGLDLAAPSGTPIHAAQGGVVNFVGDRNDCYGNIVVVDHPNGVQTWYAHQVRFGKFVVGDRVERLDIIGYVGTTGCSTGNHLHFEVRIGGKPRNPLAYLPRR
ncbi:MAG: metalloendopeptidase-like rane protein [Thermoleophilia bacterium]|nr:metalloendopeptidase-like rane protein [Thermoleophilia bacterium]